MSGIYIKEVQLPSKSSGEGHLEITIYSDGSAYCRSATNGCWQTAIAVPEHGRLIDADEIKKDIDEQRPGRCYEDAWALTILDNARTIIPKG